MKKTVPLRKELPFKSNVSQIVSISLDDDFKLEDRTVTGVLHISGSYKMNDTSVNTEEFNYDIPVNIELSDRYSLDNINITVDDFYYELIDDNILSINVEIGLDNLEEHPIKYNEEIIEKVDELDKEDDEVNMSRDDKPALFDSFNDDSYCSYKVYMVKENDTIESIMSYYKIDRETLEQYNDLQNIKIGDKLIIPYIFDETNK